MPFWCFPPVLKKKKKAKNVHPSWVFFYFPLNGHTAKTNTNVGNNWVERQTISEPTIICVPKRTHRFFRTHWVCCRTLSESAVAFNSTLETVILLPLPDFRPPNPRTTPTKLTINIVSAKLGVVRILCFGCRHFAHHLIGEVGFLGMVRGGSPL